MYGKGGILGAATTTTAVAGAVALPDTGGNIVVTLAISIASGLIVWGVMYARSAAVSTK